MELDATNKGEVGTLVGWSRGLIENSYAEGKIIGTGVSTLAYVGGLVGTLSNGGKINNCYTNVNIELVREETARLSNSDWSIGGLVGYAADVTNEISNSHALGDISIHANEVGIRVGGLVGLGSVTITGSHATGKIEVVQSKKNVSQNYNSSIGGLAAGGANISNSYATGNIYVLMTHSTMNVGGLAGSGSSTNSYATGNIETMSVDRSLSTYVGGLVGSGNITNSYATGNISATSDSNDIEGILGTKRISAGGLAGLAGTISNSYAIGDIFTSIIINEIAYDLKSCSGGLAGVVTNEIINSYSKSRLTSYNSFPNRGFSGGLVGCDKETDVGGGPYKISSLNSFWNLTTSELNNSIGSGTIIGTPIGLTDAQSKLQSSYVGFDFTNVWQMGTYPYLRGLPNPY